MQQTTYANTQLHVASTRAAGTRFLAWHAWHLPYFTAVKLSRLEQALRRCDRNQKLFTLAKRHVRAACRCFSTLISTSIQHLVNLLHDVRQLCVGGYQQNIDPTTCLDVHIKPLHTLGICTISYLVREECADFDSRYFFVVCVGGAYPGLVAADHHSAHILLHPAVPCAVHTAIRGSNDTGNGMRWYSQSSRWMFLLLANITWSQQCSNMLHVTMQ